MDLRAFLHEHLDRRPIAIIGGAGGVLALIAGLSLGSYLSAGELLDQAPAPQMIVPAAEAAGYEGVSYMTDASGRIPDYVLGTDSTRPPEPMPTIRTAWSEQEADPGYADQATEPTGPVVVDIDPAPAAIATPSTSGNILAVDAPQQPAAPLG